MKQDVSVFFFPFIVFLASLKTVFPLEKRNRKDGRGSEMCTWKESWCRRRWQDSPAFVCGLAGQTLREVETPFATFLSHVGEDSMFWLKCRQGVNHRVYF